MKRIWLHGASAGDMRALRPLVERIESHPQVTTAALTTWTQSGLSVAGQIFPSLEASRAPLPLWPFTSAFLERVQPDVLVLEYLEWYPPWLAACWRRGVPVVFVDGRVSHRSLRIKGWLKRTAHCIDSFGARSTQDAENAIRLGVPADRVFVTGNGKYDGFPAGPPVPRASLRAAVGSMDVVVGSLHPDEEEDLVRALVGGRMKALIAPRYLDRIAPLERRLRQAGLSVARRSEGLADADIMLLDTMGELAEAYALAPAAIVGGTFGRREGQNLFEPAIHNRIVIHGPRTANIQAEVDCLSGQGAYLVETWSHALQKASSVADLPPSESSTAIRALRGASDRNLGLVLDVLNRACKLSGDQIGRMSA